MPTSISTGAWLDQLNTELEGSDRACAVLAGAVLDDHLLQLINKFLLPPMNAREDRLLGRGGALESFSSRIELARRLSLVALEVSKSLNWVRDIRNDAAHREQFSFDDSANRDRVNNIVEALELRSRGPGLFREPYATAKGNFVVATAMLVLRIDVEASSLNPVHHTPLSNDKVSIGA